MTILRRTCIYNGSENNQETILLQYHPTKLNKTLFTLNPNVWLGDQTPSLGMVSLTHVTSQTASPKPAQAPAGSGVKLRQPPYPTAPSEAAEPPLRGFSPRTILSSSSPITDGGTEQSGGSKRAQQEQVQRGDTQNPELTGRWLSNGTKPGADSYLRLGKRVSN